MNHILFSEQNEDNHTPIFVCLDFFFKMLDLMVVAFHSNRRFVIGRVDGGFIIGHLSLMIDFFVKDFCLLVLDYKEIRMYLLFFIFVGCI